MSRDKKSKVSKLLTVVSSMGFVDRVRHLRIEKKSPTILCPENSPEEDAEETAIADGCSNAAAEEPMHSQYQGDGAPSRCLHGAVVSKRRGGSEGSSDIASSMSDETSRLSLTTSLSIKEESPKCYEEVELTDEQKDELKQAFSMFEKAGKGKIPARDLGELLRCLGWNPSEQDLEEARHELELTTRGTISFAEIESYIARRGGIYYGNNAEEDIMVAFQVLDKRGSGRIQVSDFRHFMTTMGERMTQEEAEELISRSTQDGKDYIEYRDLVDAVQLLPT
ncbi:calmodulin [Biomphalaria glabrata]|nr:calmodulin [Biomphalaria glabrata]